MVGHRRQGVVPNASWATVQCDVSPPALRVKPRADLPSVCPLGQSPRQPGSRGSTPGGQHQLRLPAQSYSCTVPKGVGVRFTHHHHITTF